MNIAVVEFWPVFGIYFGTELHSDIAMWYSMRYVMFDITTQEISLLDIDKMRAITNNKFAGKVCFYSLNIKATGSKRTNEYIAYMHIVCMLYKLACNKVKMLLHFPYIPNRTRWAQYSHLLWGNE